MCQIGFIQPDSLAHIKATILNKVLTLSPGHTVAHQLLHFPLGLTVDNDRYGHLLSITPMGKAAQK